MQRIVKRSKCDAYTVRSRVGIKGKGNNVKE